MATVFWISVALLVYVTAGYPLLLLAIARVRGARPVRRGAALPPVSLVISAFNEASSIREKIENALALDYPADALEIVVVSDASDDGTDEIVRSFADRGVRLARQVERRGKTAGLNACVPTLRGEIVVFSDANAMYEPDAVRMLVRNFGDPSVGCVTGEARYVRRSTTAAETGEMAYWNYEIGLKKLETAVGSMVGGDGAIYAIRAQLWRRLPDDAINDFLNPLQIVAAGWRSVYEPAAVAYEEAAGSASREYHRRVRIVSRSWRAILLVPSVLLPWKVGLFAPCIFSHKILRWFSGWFLLCAGASAVALAMPSAHPLQVAVAVGAVVLVLVLPAARRAASYVLYYVWLSVASIVGVFKGTTGRVSATWTTPRAEISDKLLVRGGALLAAALVLEMAAVMAAGVLYGHVVAGKVLFWTSGALLVYVYVAYPLVLWVAGDVARKPARKHAVEPCVCLLIAANDEDAVIGRKLENSLDLDYPAGRLRVLVASDGSIDRTNAIVRTFTDPRVELLAFSERRGKMAAINEAFGHIGEEIVVLSDANTFLAPDAIRALVANFADDTVGAVSGDVVLVGERASLGRSEDLYYRYERWLQQAESDVGSMIGVDGALYALRRELFEPPPADTILDDMAIPMAVIRAGRRVVFEPTARATERGSDTAREEFARKSRVVAGAVQFLLRRASDVPLRNGQVVLALVSHKALRWLSPVFALVMFAAALLLSPDSRTLEVIAGAQAASLCVAVAGCSPRLRRWPPIGFAHYFWLVQGAAAVGFVRGVAGRQSVAWRRFQRLPLETAS